MCSYLENVYETYFLVNACPIFYFFSWGGVWKVMLKEKGGSAKIKQAIDIDIDIFLFGVVYNI